MCIRDRCNRYPDLLGVKGAQVARQARSENPGLNRGIAFGTVMLERCV